MWFRQVLVILLLIGATALLGRYVAHQWPSQEGRFLTAEEFFGEHGLQVIEASGIPFSTHGWLLGEMYGGSPHLPPEETIPALNIELCILPEGLTLHFGHRVWNPEGDPFWETRFSYLALSDIQYLERGCSNEAAIEMIREDSAEAVHSWQSDDLVLELELDEFPHRTRRGSNIFVELRLNNSGELLSAMVREEWQVVTFWGRWIAQLEQDADPSDGERWLGHYSFPLQVGIYY